MSKLYAVVFGLILASACGIQIKQAPLTDEWGRTWYSEDGRAFQDRDIFNDGSSDIWGLEKTECKNFVRQDSQAFKGSSCLRIEFNREGKCPWIGLGIGWNGYVAKDISSVINTDQIEFYIRSVKGNHHSPTLIFLFEDYSGNMSAAAFKPAYLSKYPIDESWQKAQIPLSAFERKCDFSNIKSLNIECQGNASILLDEIRIVSGSVAVRKKEKWGKTISVNNSYSLYPGVTWWGEAKTKAIKLEVDTINVFENKPTINIRWNAFGKQAIQLAGFSWSNWEATSFADSVNSYELLINYQLVSGKFPRLVFENYKGKTASYSVQLEAKANDKSWKQVRVPLSQFDFKAASFDTNWFKQLILEGESEGEFILGSIQLLHVNK